MFIHWRPLIAALHTRSCRDARMEEYAHHARQSPLFLEAGFPPVPLCTRLLPYDAPTSGLCAAGTTLEKVVRAVGKLWLIKQLSDAAKGEVGLDD